MIGQIHADEKAEILDRSGESLIEDRLRCIVWQSRNVIHLSSFSATLDSNLKPQACDGGRTSRCESCDVAGHAIMRCFDTQST